VVGVRRYRRLAERSSMQDGDEREQYDADVGYFAWYLRVNLVSI
jgi:hypothetical protein